MGRVMSGRSRERVSCSLVSLDQGGDDRGAGADQRHHQTPGDLDELELNGSELRAKGAVLLSEMVEADRQTCQLRAHGFCVGRELLEVRDAGAEHGELL